MRAHLAIVYALILNLLLSPAYVDDNVFFDTDLLGSGVTRETDPNGNRQVLAVALMGDSAFNLTGSAGDTLSLGTGNLNASLGTDRSAHTISTGAINTSNPNVTFTEIDNGTLRLAELDTGNFVTVDDGRGLPQRHEPKGEQG